MSRVQMSCDKLKHDISGLPFRRSSATVVVSKVERLTSFGLDSPWSDL